MRLNIRDVPFVVVKFPNICTGTESACSTRVVETSASLILGHSRYSDIVMGKEFPESLLQLIRVLLAGTLQLLSICGNDQN
jgi:hypothetical protein